MQVTHYLLSLIHVNMISMSDLSRLQSDQTLGTDGIAELFHKSAEQTEGTVGMLSQGACYADLADMQPQTLLSLVWPRYLDELAASKSPITQVHTLPQKLTSACFHLMKTARGHAQPCLNESNAACNM